MKVDLLQRKITMRFRRMCPLLLSVLVCLAVRPVVGQDLPELPDLKAAHGKPDGGAEAPRVLKDGVIFEMLIPARAWPIPARPAGRNPIKLGLKITNETDAPLRFSRFDTI